MHNRFDFGKQENQKRFIICLSDFVSKFRNFNRNKTMSLIIETQEYMDAMNANFLGGVGYTCDELLGYLSEKKRTIKDVENWAKNQRKEALKTRKLLTVSRKVIKKATVLH